MKLNDLVPLSLLLLPTANALVADPDRLIEKRATCTNDEILKIFKQFSALAKPFCSAYTTHPKSTSVPAFAQPWASVPSKISSACSCLTVATVTSSSTTPSLTSSSSSTAISDPYPSSSSSSTPISDPYPSSSSTTTTIITDPTPTPTSSSTTTTPCTVTVYSDLPAATASCTSIVIKDLTVPGNSTLDLSKLKTGTKVKFSGYTTFEYADFNIDLIKVGGTDIDISAEPDAIIDGNGQAWWDGLGSNGGVAKPNHFVTVSKALGSSVIHDLYIQNYPVHCFSISNCANLTIHSILLNNTAGAAPNNRSNGLAAAHNTDGFDLSSCNDTVLRDSTVLNQDDCVAITSGNNIVVSGMYCDGGHGLSIGSVGGKSNNNVTNISFLNSRVLNSENGPRIKTNYNTTGYIANITYSNIYVSNISNYGIDIQQDYLNGGPTGTPTNGVIITNIVMNNVYGTAQSDARDYYILCGDGSCSNFTFNNVHITGGTNDSCNVVPEGNFSC